MVASPMPDAAVPRWLVADTNLSLAPQLTTCWDEVLCHTSVQRPSCTFQGRGLICGLERHTQWLVNTYVPRDATVLELGARFGTVTCAISRRLGYSSRQVSVEPDPEAFKALSANVAANGCAVDLVHGAVSQRPLFSMPAMISRRRAGGYATRTMSGQQCAGKRCQQLSTYSIRQLAERLSAKLAKNVTFDTLVIDCEKCWGTLMQEELAFLRSPGLRRILYELDERSEAVVRQICSLGFGVVLNEIDCMLPRGRISQLVFERGSHSSCNVVQRHGIECPWRLAERPVALERPVSSSQPPLPSLSPPPPSSSAPSTMALQSERAVLVAAGAQASKPAAAPSTNEASCRCFEICNRSAAVEFLRRVPLAITDPSSPWIGYLTAVYGSRPTLPFDMTKLNFFYHNHGRWPTSVEWPMAHCRIAVRQFCGKFNGGACAAPAQAPRCSEAMCSRWLLPPSQARQWTAGYIGINHVSSDVDPLRSTYGTAIFAYADKLAQQGLHNLSQSTSDQDMQTILQTFAGTMGHAVPRSSSWVEVIRENDKMANKGASIEGKDGYGCWFWPVRGSGIWIRVGRLISIHSKDVLFNLRSEWLANTSLDHSASDRIFASAHHGEYFPMMAYQLGYDAVFNQFRDLRGTRTARPCSELVVTTRKCVWPTSAELEQRKGGATNLGACIPWIEKRRGFAAEGPCHCDDDGTETVNCAASSSRGESDVAHQMHGPGKPVVDLP